MDDQKAKKASDAFELLRAMYAAKVKHIYRCFFILVF